MTGRRQHRTCAVLVVQPDEDVRDRIGEWLEDDGFEVLSCPGPTAPGYTCIGGRGVTCPLESGARIVVLDLCLASDLAMEGTPAEELMRSYVWHGNRVVAIRHGADAVAGLDADAVIVIPSPPERSQLVRAVREHVRREDATSRAVATGGS